MWLFGVSWSQSKVTEKNTEEFLDEMIHRGKDDRELYQKMMKTQRERS